MFPIGALISVTNIEGKEVPLIFKAVDEIYEYGIDNYELCFIGPAFTVTDDDGEALLSCYIESIGDFPKWLVEFCYRNHINLDLPDHLFVPVTETFNPYKS